VRRGVPETLRALGTSPVELKRRETDRLQRFLMAHRLAWIPTEADVSNKILSKVIILGHPAWEEVSQLQNL
jgi:hypothetical protein